MAVVKYGKNSTADVDCTVRDTAVYYTDSTKYNTATTLQVENQSFAYKWAFMGFDLSSIDFNPKTQIVVSATLKLWAYVETGGGTKTLQVTPGLPSEMLKIEDCNYTYRDITNTITWGGINGIAQAFSWGFTTGDTVTTTPAWAEIDVTGAVQNYLAISRYHERKNAGEDFCNFRLYTTASSYYIEFSSTENSSTAYRPIDEIDIQNISYDTSTVGPSSASPDYTTMVAAESGEQGTYSAPTVKKFELLTGYTSSAGTYFSGYTLSNGSHPIVFEGQGITWPFNFSTHNVNHTLFSSGFTHGLDMAHALYAYDCFLQFNCYGGVGYHGLRSQQHPMRFENVVCQGYADEVLIANGGAGFYAENSLFVADNDSFLDSSNDWALIQQYGSGSLTLLNCTLEWHGGWEPASDYIYMVWVSGGYGKVDIANTIFVCSGSTNERTYDLTGAYPHYAKGGSNVSTIASGSYNPPDDGTTNTYSTTESFDNTFEDAPAAPDYAWSTWTDVAESALTLKDYADFSVDQEGTSRLAGHWDIGHYQASVFTPVSTTKTTPAEFALQLSPATRQMTSEFLGMFEKASVLPAELLLQLTPLEQTVPTEVLEGRFPTYVLPTEFLSSFEELRSLPSEFVLAIEDTRTLPAELLEGISPPATRVLPAEFHTGLPPKVQTLYIVFELEPSGNFYRLHYASTGDEVRDITSKLGAETRYHVAAMEADTR